MCIEWWINNLNSAYKPIQITKPDIIIESDSSLTGYGAHCVTSNEQYSGMWSEEHINVLELKAAYLAIKHLCRNSYKINVQLLLDNTTAIKYITKMGGRIPKLNNLAKELWLWCANRDIWITVFHIPGKLNVRADALSRQKLSHDTEWSINSKIFKQIMDTFGLCDIDLFTSNKNYQLPQYVSYTLDA